MHYRSTVSGSARAVHSKAHNTYRAGPSWLWGRGGRGNLPVGLQLCAGCGWTSRCLTLGLWVTNQRTPVATHNTRRLTGGEPGWSSLSLAASGTPPSVGGSGEWGVLLPAQLALALSALMSGAGDVNACMWHAF